MSSRINVNASGSKRRSRSGTMRQLLRLPRTLAAIFQIVREDRSPARADEHLWAFRGFHLDPQDPNYRTRPWRKTPIRDVGRDQVVDIRVGELAFMMQGAIPRTTAPAIQRRPRCDSEEDCAISAEDTSRVPARCRSRLPDRSPSPQPQAGESGAQQQ